MREILFRGKRIDNGEWVEGDLIQLDDQICISSKSMWSTELSEGSIQLECINVIPESVGQFTGLIDKNGVKVFEGDIVQYSNPAYRNPVIIKWHEFYSCTAFYEVSDLDTPYFLNAKICKESVEVIGNIFDNPELIK